METYATSVAASAMVQDEDGTYYGTVLASKHNLGENAFVVRAVRRDTTAQTEENVLCSYKTLTNGDIRIYADEPTSIRVTLGRGNPVNAS